MTVAAAIRFSLALAIIAGLIAAAYPGDPAGAWYYDSKVYLRSTYDPAYGRPPVYPAVLGILGRNVVYYQTIFAVLSFCLVGYVLAGFPGLILLGLLSVSPWFSRWHSNCLTESVSHSLLALTIAFSVLSIRRRSLLIPWAASLCLFSLTRYTNALYLPLSAWPALFIRGKVRWAVLAAPLLVAIPSILSLGEYERGAIEGRGIAAASAALSPSSYRTAGEWVINARTRPFFRGRPIMPGSPEYRPALSRESDLLEPLKLGEHGWLWLPLLALAVADILLRGRISPGPASIFALAAFAYAVALGQILADTMTGDPGEVWRHLKACDAALAFALAAGIGIVRGGRKGEAGEPAGKLETAKAIALSLAALSLFAAALYSPKDLQPGDPGAALALPGVDPRSPLGEVR